MICSAIIPTVNRPTLDSAEKTVLDRELGLESHEIIAVNDSGIPLPEREWLKSPKIKILNTY